MLPTFPSQPFCSGGLRQIPFHNKELQANDMCYLHVKQPVPISRILQSWTRRALDHAGTLKISAPVWLQSESLSSRQLRDLPYDPPLTLNLQFLHLRTQG